MYVLSFSLQPYQGEEPGGYLKIEGTIGRRSDTLSIGYALLGNLSELALPAPAESPGRKDRLLEGTGLELFLGKKNRGRYWEFLLSPAGHWNVYRYASYRKEMREEPAFAPLPSRVRMEPGALRLSLDLGLGKIIPPGRAIEGAVGAVIRTVTGKTNHWALLPPAPP